MQNNVFVLALVLLISMIYGQCTQGYYSNANSICVACPPGTFSTNNAVGISNCIPCSTGTYSSSFGNVNCTACTDGKVCSRGSARPFASSELISKIIDPSKPFNAQNWKIGFVFILMLIFFIPLIAFALTCWEPTLCGLFDVAYNEKHYIHEGDARIKKRDSCGGFCLLMVMALFTMAFGAIIVDFYFSNIFRVGKFSPSTQIGRSYPVGNFSVMGLVKIVGVNSSDCQAATITTGYSVQIGGSLISGCVSDGMTCTCNTTCTNCALAANQNLIITFSNERIFASSIFYTYSVSQFGDNYMVNGTILPPTDQVFYGASTSHRVRMTLFSAYLNGIQGGEHGGAQWSQWVDTFLHDFRYYDRGLVFQVEDVVKGPAVANLTGSGGLVLTFDGTFGPYDYIVDETFRQTVWNHIAELVSVCILFLFFGYVLLIVWEFIREKWEEQVKAGRVRLFLRYGKTPFRFVWRSLLNLCRKEKLDLWAHSDEEKSEDEKEHKEDKVDETKSTLERLNNQINELDTKLIGEQHTKEEVIIVDDHHDATPVIVAKSTTENVTHTHVELTEEKPLLMHMEQPKVEIEQENTVDQHATEVVVEHVTEEPKSDVTHLDSHLDQHN